MKRRILYFTGILSSIITALTTVYGFILTNKLMYLKVKDPEFIRRRETHAKRFNENWYETVRKEEMWIESPNGYPLKAVFLQPLDTAQTVIICHGVTENKINSVKYARLFERLGFNSVIYDHRRHGDSGGKTTSFGFYEKADLKAVVETFRKRIGSDSLLGIHGESMGAASTILYAGTFEDQADFHIVDCAFSDFNEQVLHIMRKDTPLRNAMVLRVGNLFMKMRDGYSLNLVSPREVVGNITKPVLFIHSMEDDFIQAYMTVELHEAKQGDKMLKLFTKGAHAKSFNDNPREYELTVKEFLTHFNLTN